MRFCFLLQTEWLLIFQSEPGYTCTWHPARHRRCEADARWRPGQATGFACIATEADRYGKATLALRGERISPDFGEATHSIWMRTRRAARPADTRLADGTKPAAVLRLPGNALLLQTHRLPAMIIRKNITLPLNRPNLRLHFLLQTGSLRHISNWARPGLQPASEVLTLVTRD